MTRQRVGWGLVAAAAVLLVLQLLPTVVRAIAPASMSPARSGPRPFTAASSRDFVPHRLAPVEETLYVDRAGSGTRLELVGWDGGALGSVDLPTVRQVQPSLGYSQSPSGARFLDDFLLLGIDGRTTDLAEYLGGRPVEDFTWRDDSQGACAVVRGDAGPELLEFVFNPKSTEMLRFGLPGDLKEGMTRVLACSGLRREVVLGAPGPPAEVVVLDLVTGQELGRRQFAGAGFGVVSPDAKLIAVTLAPGQPGHGGPPTTLVEDLDTGQVVLELGAEAAVRAFSADSAAVLVSVQAGTEIVRIAGGATIWTDSAGRQLRGWTARPYTHDFALALSHLDLGTCTKGEPGKFPEFCGGEGPPDLVVVRGDSGAVVSLGRGHGAWDNRVSSVGSP